ncbi:MAG: helix-turn-helix transcriptional regulator [Zoogloea sp.]|nr:MAG: helix-turn-helix transcriptional regulator [Zoogloea sp.]
MSAFDEAATGCISVRALHRIRTLSVRDDALIWVRKGCKTLLGAQGPQEVPAGRVVVLARGSCWDVINDPRSDGRYEAHVLQFGDAAVSRFAARHGGDFPQAPLQDARVLTPDGGLAECLERTLAGLAAPGLSQGLRQHRVEEVLLMLAEAGCVLRPRGVPDWPEQVRRLILGRPHAEWTVETIAAACQVSASTLRRRLAAHGLACAALVREVRLEVGLGLLQSTGLPVGEIAARCGYDSHSRFTAAFRSRFGFAPSRLRGPG